MLEKIITIWNCSINFLRDNFNDSSIIKFTNFKIFYYHSYWSINEFFFNIKIVINIVVTMVTPINKTKIVKKHTTKFFRHQSDRFKRVDVININKKFYNFI